MPSSPTVGRAASTSRSPAAARPKASKANIPTTSSTASTMLTMPTAFAQRPPSPMGGEPYAVPERAARGHASTVRRRARTVP